jgi:hypothetical protein
MYIHVRNFLSGFVYMLYRRRERGGWKR